MYNGMMTNQRQQIGRMGEQLAAKHLQENGLYIISMNVRTAYGELDIIAKDGETTVFVEVKTRSNLSYGQPETGMTAVKIGHLLNSVQAYLLEHEECSGDWRIDVVAIVKKTGVSPEIVWFKNALV